MVFLGNYQDFTNYVGNCLVISKDFRTTTCDQIRIVIECSCDFRFCMLLLRLRSARARCCGEVFVVLLSRRLLWGGCARAIASLFYCWAGLFREGLLHRCGVAMPGYSGAVARGQLHRFCIDLAMMCYRIVLVLQWRGDRYCVAIASLLYRCQGLLYRGEGPLYRCAGLLYRCEGLLYRCEGLLYRCEGLVCCYAGATARRSIVSLRRAIASLLYCLDGRLREGLFVVALLCRAIMGAFAPRPLHRCCTARTGDWAKDSCIVVVFLCRALRGGCARAIASFLYLSGHDGLLQI